MLLAHIDFTESSKWSLSLVHWATQSWGRLLIWQLSRRQSLTPFTRRVNHKHSFPKKLAVHRVLYPSMLTESWVEGKSVEEKDAQPTERTAALCGLSIDSRIWANFTMNGLRLGSRHQEPPHTDLSRNLATVVVRGVLPGLRRRRTGLLPSGPKVLFSDESKFCISFGNQGPRVWKKGGEAHSPRCLKSSVKFTQSVMIQVSKTPVEWVNSFKFGVHITKDLTWSAHTDAVLKKAHQRLFFLRRLRKFGTSPSILRSFYTCTVESILTGCITAWFGNSTAGNRKALQTVVRTARHIVGGELPSLQDIYTRRCIRKARRIIKDSMQFHLLVLVHCIFWKPTSLHTFTKKFWSTSRFLLLTSFLMMLISFSSRIWHLSTLPKAPKVD